MKKLLATVILTLSLSLLFTACDVSDGGDGAISNQGDNNNVDTSEDDDVLGENTVTPQNIVGYWLHEDDVLGYFFHEDYTFDSYSFGSLSVSGTYTIEGDTLHLAYSADNVTIVTVNLSVSSMTADTGGVYYYTSDTSPESDYDDDEAVDYHAFLYGDWALYPDLIMYSFYTDGTYEAFNTSGRFDNGTYIFDGYAVEIISEGGSSTMAYYSLMEDTLTYDYYGGIFIKETINFDGGGTATEDQNGFLPGEWVGFNVSDRLIVYPDGTYEHWYEENVTYGTYEVHDDVNFSLYYGDQFFEGYLDPSDGTIFVDGIDWMMRVD